MPQSQDKVTLSASLLSTLDRQRRQFKARFVRAGKILGAANQPSNTEITESALVNAVARGLFDSKAVFIDHSDLFSNPSLRNLVGVTHAATWNPDTSSVEGSIHLYAEAGDIATLVDEILAEGSQAPDVGLSIVFWPIFAPRDDEAEPRRIVDIRHVESVDLVFQPAAGGRILQALSTFHISQGEKPMSDQPIQTSTPAQAPAATNAAYAGAAAPGAAPPTTGVAALGDAAQMWLPAMARAAAQTMINASTLPAPSKERLLSVPFNNPAEVEAAIQAEATYLARLSEASVVQVGGIAPRGSSIQVGLDALDRVSLALDSLLTGARLPDGIPPLSGIREAYILLSGDYEMTGLFHPERLMLANVNSSTMAGLVANALNKRIVNMFQEYPRWWEAITTIEDFSNLQQVKWITVGGVGELPTVVEGAAYTELTWDDQTETASFVKKGGYLGITLEAIDKDDTRRLQAAPRVLAQAAWLTLAKSISTIFTSPPTMSDSVALFHASHSNLGSTALSVTSFNATRVLMRKQTELNSGERLGALTSPRFLLVPPDLEITGLQVLASEEDYLYALSNGQAAPVNVNADGDTFTARMMAARDRVIVVDLWTDTNDWVAVADPRLYPSIGLGFRYGRTPEIFSVASPTAGLMFTNDTMPVKVRFFFAVGPTNWRGMYKHIVT